jgi:hypothetical protein
MKIRRGILLLTVLMASIIPVLSDTKPGQSISKPNVTQPKTIPGVYTVLVLAFENKEEDFIASPSDPEGWTIYFEKVPGEGPGAHYEARMTTSKGWSARYSIQDADTVDPKDGSRVYTIQVRVPPNQPQLVVK